MRDSSALPKEFESLKQRTDAHRRGYDFQPFVGRIFQAKHFRVEKKPRAAKPRQVDLFATRGDEVYLIETKWRKDRIVDLRQTPAICDECSKSNPRAR